MPFQIFDRTTGDVMPGTFKTMDDVGQELVGMFGDQIPEALDVREIPSAWEELVKNQPQEMNQAIKDATKAQVAEDISNEGILKSGARAVASMVYPQTLATIGRGGTDEEARKSLFLGDIPAQAGLAISALTMNPIPAYLGMNVGPMLGTLAGKEENSQLERYLTAGTPAIGMGLGAIGRTAQKIAPATAYYAVKPIMKMMGNPNPPNFKKMLEEDMLPYFGGLKGSLNRLLFKTKPMREAYQKSINDADERGVRISIDDVRKSAIEAVNSDNRISMLEKPAILDKINESVDQYLDIGLATAKRHKELVPDALALEKNRAELYKYKIDKGQAEYTNKKITEKNDANAWTVVNPGEYGANRFAKPIPFKDVPPRPIAQPEFMVEDVIESPRTFGVRQSSREKTALQDVAFNKFSNTDRGGGLTFASLSRGMNKAIENSAPEVRDASRALAPYEAYRAALERRLGIPAAQNEGLGLNDYQSMIAGSEVLGQGIKGALAGFLAKRLMSTTGGAQMLYDVGGKLVSLDDLIRMRVR